MIKRTHLVRLKPLLSPIRSLFRLGTTMYLNNPIRRYWIHRSDAIELRNTKLATARSVIIFLVPGLDIVNGGVRSIISLAEESEKLTAIHNSMVFVCSMPGDPPLQRFTKFNNSVRIFSLWSVIQEAAQVRGLLVHIPEVYVRRFDEYIRVLDTKRTTCRLRFNVMLQNIDFLPEASDLASLKQIGTISCSTAHRQYFTTAVANRLGCQLFHFSTLVDPSLYKRKTFAQKDNLIILSPDFAPEREQIIDALSAYLPGFEVRIVQNITFETYSEWIESAKFTITFGEGLDGYFVESIFSGAIGCAKYNDRFFTENFKDMPFVFSSWADMATHLPEMIHQTNEANAFETIQSAQYLVLCEVYRYSEYIDNLKHFYEVVNFDCSEAPKLL